MNCPKCGMSPDVGLGPDMPSASGTVAEAVLHMYREMKDDEAPSQVRLKAAMFLAENAERLLAAAGSGEAANILKLVSDATRG